MLDLIIIGGGINGAGIARDAAGRGLKVLLCEKDDLASHTSSASSKLIHGGLRYLEYYEFRLVAEALSERETLLRIAPHIIWPLEFVMPHVPELRPAWMIRAGLLLYDHLGRREKLPGSRGITLRGAGYGEGIRADIDKGFVYADCWVDDARLVAINARAAADLGATIRTRTACVAGRRSPDGWEIDLRDAAGNVETVRAKGVVNAAGPWVKNLLDTELQQPTRAGVKQIKGSHIVVKRLFPGAHAFILQNDDKRIVFMIPYEGEFTLIGTTDIEVRDLPGAAAITPDEITYLCRAANRYLARPIAPADVVWSYSGVRPLYDDGQSDPSAITRDYTLVLDVAYPQSPLLSVFGGKITTYRRLAESVLDKLRPSFPHMTGSWTGARALPGGDMPGADFEAFALALAQRYPELPASYPRALARRHGTRAGQILGSAAAPADLGTHFGDTLYAAEIDYLVASEWAVTADDILWRRTKCGLHLNQNERDAVAAYLATRN
ncbi:MAG: glycerol-3-phosphate dehydrogenase [Betaproteobacteria bacterium]|nr:glycerol-3-phosphate dehydrogenase [Betaproteobacteria bacterium]